MILYPLRLFHLPFHSPGCSLSLMMNNKNGSITALKILIGECHRMCTELKKNIVRSTLTDVHSEFLALKIELFNQNSLVLNQKMIISPYDKIIKYSDITDSLVLIILDSLINVFKYFKFKKDECLDNFINEIYNMDYQTTTDFSPKRIVYQMLKLFNTLITYNEECLSYDIFYIIHSYFLKEISNITGVLQTPLNLSETISRYVNRIFSDSYSDLIDMRKYVINSYFYLSTSFQSSNNSVQRFIALTAIHEISLIFSEMERDLLISVSAIILNQQLKLSDSKDNFFLSLRIFFNVFHDNCFNYFPIFCRCFSCILKYMKVPSNNELFRISCFEIMSDILLIKGFPVKFFAETYNRPMYCNLFEDILDIIKQYIVGSKDNPELVSLSLKLVYVFFSSVCVLYDPSPFDNSEEFSQIEELKKFALEFNKGFSSFINNEEYTAENLAWHLFVSPDISPVVVGEFFGKNKSFCEDTLVHFLKQFDFSSLSFDESIRIFLTSFKITGEGQIVDRILDFFSREFYKTHKDEFSDAASIHVLSYAWLMIHTSYYNSNATKQTFDSFKSMLRGQNGNKDFDDIFLRNLYTSISTFSIPSEENHKINSVAFWMLHIQRMNRWRLCTRTENDIVNLSPIYLNLIWDGIYDVLSENFDKVPDYKIIMDIFSSIPLNYSMLNITEHVDWIIDTLYTKAFNDLQNERSIKIVEFLILLINKDGSSVRNGWKQYLQLLVSLFQMSLLNDEMCSTMSIVDKYRVVISPKMFNKPERQNTFHNVLKKLSRSDSETYQNSNILKDVVNSSGIHELSKCSVKFSFQSLQSLYNAFDNLIRIMEKNFDSNSVNILFCVNVVCQVTIENSQRIVPLWSIVCNIFQRALLLIGNSKSGKYLGNLLLNMFFTSFNELWHEESMRKSLLEALQELCELKSFLISNFSVVDAGITQFFENHFTTFSVMFNWSCILKIVQYGIEEPSENSVQSIFHKLITNTPFDHPCVPGESQFKEFWIPVIDIALSFCSLDKYTDYVSSFQDLQSLLIFPSMPDLNPNNWLLVYEKSLLPTMNILISNYTKNASSCQRLLFMLKIIVRTFLINIIKIADLSSFETLWLRILKNTLDLARLQSAELKDSIPEILSNALRVMGANNIFGSPQRQKVLILTRSNIEKIFPNFVINYPE